MQNRGVRDDRPGPEADAQNASEGYVQKSDSGTQAGEIADAADDYRHHRSAHDSRAQNSSERPVVL